MRCVDCPARWQVLATKRTTTDVAHTPARTVVVVREDDSVAVSFGTESDELVVSCSATATTGESQGPDTRERQRSNSSTEWLLPEAVSGENQARPAV